VVIVLNAALAAFYYLRVIVYMYMREPEPDPATIESSPFGTLALVLSVAGVLALGILPGAVLSLLEVSTASLF
jgi:NADH-quinone oxidoreductase subunit N